MKNQFKKLIYCSSLLILVYSCSSSNSESSTAESMDDTMSNPLTVEELSMGEEENPDYTDSETPIIVDYDVNYSFATIKNDDGTWGYEILDDSSTFIRQPFIPSIQGNKGFTTEDKAVTTAKFVIHKLYNGYFPPSVTKAELDSLKVLN